MLRSSKILMLIQGKVLNRHYSGKMFDNQNICHGYANNHELTAALPEDHQDPTLRSVMLITMLKYLGDRSYSVNVALETICFQVSSRSNKRMLWYLTAIELYYNQLRLTSTNGAKG